MEKERKKCSSSKHKNFDAISYCKNCRLYLCNKCKNNHSEFYESHNIINLDAELDIFISECQKENHDKNELKFFCKNHNVLCCIYCINKINNFCLGEHYNCDCCHIDEIKEEKWNKIKEDLDILLELSNNIEQITDELKKLVEKINGSSEALKSSIQKTFTKIRNALNEKEDKLLQEVDEFYNNNFFNDDIIKESEKLPNKIKKVLQRKKILEKEWEDNNLVQLINDYINIENNIKEINLINKTIHNFKTIGNNIIKFILDEDIFNTILKGINNIGKLISEKEDIYKNFNINLKNPKHVLNYHKDKVWCLIHIDDGRLVSSSADNSIIIYNQITYKPDLIIKEHAGDVFYITQLSSGFLASGSSDCTIKLFKIKGKEYEIIQTLNYHSKPIYKLLEIKNDQLISCSDDGNIIIYKKNNLQYKKNYLISTKFRCSSVIQTKEDEICFSVFTDEKGINFYDLLTKKIKASLSSISKCNNQREWFIVFKDLLLVPGQYKISIININEYKLIRVIDVPNSEWLCGACLLNKNMVLFGDNSKIMQWKIDKNNLFLISSKENVHNGWINILLNPGNGNILSGSDDNTIKIW